MEVSTKLLAFYPASYSWNRCWFFCFEYGIIYFYGYGVLGEEWRLVDGVLWSSRIWIWMVISTDPNNIHLAGTLGRTTIDTRLTVYNLNIISSFLFESISKDYWTYWVHRILHWPIFYTNIHKLHHTYKQPSAFSVTALHPIELVWIYSIYMSPLFLFPVHYGKNPNNNIQ